MSVVQLKRKLRNFPEADLLKRIQLSR